MNFCLSTTERIRRLRHKQTQNERRQTAKKTTRTSWNWRQKTKEAEKQTHQTRTPENTTTAAFRSQGGQNKVGHTRQWFLLGCKTQLTSLGSNHCYCYCCVPEIRWSENWTWENPGSTDVPCTQYQERTASYSSKVSPSDDNQDRIKQSMFGQKTSLKTSRFCLQWRWTVSRKHHKNQKRNKNPVQCSCSWPRSSQLWFLFSLHLFQGDWF